MKDTIPVPRCAYAHNLLDNSNFLKPVNQRGQAAYTSGWGYTIDRWYLGDSRGTGEEAQTLEIVSEGIRISGGHPSIVHRLPLLDNAKAYTFVYMVASGQCYTYSFVGATANFPQYGFAQLQCTVASGTVLVWAALYEGLYTAETLPPYHPKGYAAELAECQRYYYRSRTGIYTSGYVLNASTVRLMMPLPQPMRATPAIESYDGNAFGVCTVGGMIYNPGSTLTVPAGSGVDASYLLLDWTLAGAGMTPLTPVCTYYEHPMGFSADL